MTKNAFWLKISPINVPKNDNLFVGMLGNSVFAYLDELIIANKDPETHLKTLQVVLQRLQETDLK